jgi:hypothetical protein
MSAPIDMVLSRLTPFKLRENGRDRWRACCPAHGGSNPSALSVGIGNDGAVLLKCWHGCSADDVSGALGLDLADLFPPRESHGAPLKKRRLISAGQALDLLHDEAQFIVGTAASIAHGTVLTDDDKARALTAAGRVAYLRDEVMA